MDKSKLKIALVSLQKDAEKEPPLGLVYLATYLRDVVGLKQENIKVLDRNYFKIEKEINLFKPHLFGITAMTIDYEKATKFALKIKQKNKIPIILGGVHISTLPESFRKCFDIGVIGEGEKTLEELINLYLRKGKFNNKDLIKIKSIVYFVDNKIKKTKLRAPLELDSLPLPDFDFINRDYFKKKEDSGTGEITISCYLFSSRGCPYRCKFCSTARFWGKMRLHSPEYIARIVEDQIKKYKSDHIRVMDDLFSFSPERLDSIRKAFEERGIFDKIKGINSTVRANLVTDKLCQAMKKIKIKVVNFGFESGSDRILKYLKAGSVNVDMNKRAVIMCKKYGFSVYGSLMYGSPTETLEDMKKTNEFIDFCIKNNANYIWSFVTTPFPSTPFWDIALERGKVSNDMNFDLLTHHSIDNPLLLDPEIDKQEFKKIFLEGRKKLVKLKIKLIKDFARKNLLSTIVMFAKEPKYYAERVYLKVFKQ